MLEEKQGRRTKLWGTPSLESRRKLREKRMGHKGAQSTFSTCSHTFHNSQRLNNLSKGHNQQWDTWKTTTTTKQGLMAMYNNKIF